MENDPRVNRTQTRSKVGGKEYAREFCAFALKTNIAKGIIPSRVEPISSTILKKKKKKTREEERNRNCGKMDVRFIVFHKIFPLYLVARKHSKIFGIE